jgi:MoaA/NifB/PqqE/SkfB family radical SAM enzyme
MRLSSPYKLTFAITYKCNSRCKTCNIWQKEPVNELSLEEIRKIFARIEPPWVNITGGEPFLRRDLFEVAKIFRARRSVFLLNLTTNALCGNLILKEAKRIASLGFPKLMIVVSLDGPKTVHNSIRGTPIAWERAIAVYKGLMQIPRLKAFFGYTISGYNLGKIPDTLRELKREIPGISIEDIHFNIFHTSELFYQNQDLAESQGNPSAILKDVDYVLTHKGNFGPIQIVEKKYLRLVNRYFKTKKSPLPCKALFSSCFIEPDGEVFPCTSFPMKIGNLRESNYNLNEIWNSKKSRMVRAMVWAGKCPGCWTPCEAYQSIFARALKPW